MPLNSGSSREAPGVSLQRRPPSPRRGGEAKYHYSEQQQVFDSSELFDEDDDEYYDADYTSDYEGEDDEQDGAHQTGMFTRLARPASMLGGVIGRFVGGDDAEQQEEDFEDVLADERRRRCADGGADATVYQRDHGGLHSAFSGGGAQNSLPNVQPRYELEQEANLRRYRRPKRLGEEYSGVFQKRSPWWVDGWRPRHYVLRGNKLLYFDAAHKPDRPLGVLDLSLTQWEVHCCWPKDVDLAAANKKVDDGETFGEQLPKRPELCGVCCKEGDEPDAWSTFFLKPTMFPTKVFAFRGPWLEMQELAAKIAETTTFGGLSFPKSSTNVPIWKMPIFRSSGKHLPRISELNFWRYPYILESRLMEQVESGDILLFRGTGRSHAFTRAITASYYDHVALLLRDASSDDILILEATGSDGVTALPWAEFRARKWHTCYSRIVWRKVYFDRTDERMERLKESVMSALGHRYNLDLKNIFTRKVSPEFDADGQDISSSEVQKAMKAVERDEGPDGCIRRYFCSELVAACLKRCGVLATSTASTQYWPGTFSQHCYNPLPLHEGVHIGEEQEIVYDMT